MEFNALHLDAVSIFMKPPLLCWAAFCSIFKTDHIYLTDVFLSPHSHLAHLLHV